MLRQLQIEDLGSELIAPNDDRSGYLVVEAAKLLYKLASIRLAKEEVNARIATRVDQDSFFWRQVGVQLDAYYTKRVLELQQVVKETRRYDWSVLSSVSGEGAKDDE